jgi:predicted SprT family Zn-dependent metalloprotease
MEDGSPCQQCGTVEEDKPRQWIHNIITGHKYLCPSCEANLPDNNDPEVFAKAIRELDL